MEGSQDTSAAAETKSPKGSIPPAPTAQKDGPTDSKQTDAKPDGASASDESKPLGPPPRPGQQGNDTPDYFSGAQGGGSLSLEPNPFEQSFGAPETPGGTKLPSVAALTSPSSLIPGGGATPFNWPGGSLRSGPLSPAMLSGPASNDYFGDTHIRGGFPTPNESSLRTGLTPGGSGSMFPAPSPNSALLAQLAGGGATPSTLEFHRTALSAAAKREMQNAAQNQQQPPTSQPATSAPNNATSAPVKAEPKQNGPFDLHDNDAANGLFMLAQGRNGAQNPTNVPVTQPQVSAPQAPAVQAPAPPQPAVSNPPAQTGAVNGAASASGSRGSSESGSAASEEREQPKPATRAKGKRNAPNGTTTNGRRKAEDSATKGPAKKAKVSAPPTEEEENSEEDQSNESGSKSKMTDEEKRRNFLERNRVAALKCRQRKKQWLASLQSKVEIFSSENEALSGQIAQLREEVVNLKTLLLAHKDCPVTQQQASLQGPYMQVVEPYNGQMNPYGMAAPPMPNQQVMAGQPIQRRFS